MKLTNLLIVCAVLFFAGCKNECKDTNCLNGGICNDGKCDCPPGSSGSRCEVKDSCFGLKCENGSSCNGDSCGCLPTYYGKNCEKNKLSGNLYVVKDLYLSPLNGTQYRTDYKKYLKNDDTISVLVTVVEGNARLQFPNSEFKLTYYLSNGAFSNSENHISGEGYSDQQTGKFNTAGDSILFTVVRYDQNSNTYDSLVKCNMVKQ
jgi:hypothetical protein